jgi:hypothetical protein
MSTSTQLCSKQLKVIIEEEMNTEKCTGEVRGRLEDGETVPDPVIPSSGFNTGLSKINNEFESKCSNDAVKLL